MSSKKYPRVGRMRVVPDSEIAKRPIEQLLQDCYGFIENYMEGFDMEKPRDAEGLARVREVQEQTRIRAKARTLDIIALKLGFEHKDYEEKKNV